MSEVTSFNERKRAVVDESTALSLMSGLAIRYHRALEHQLDEVERFALIANDPAAETLKSKILPQIRSAISAEAAIGFSLRPSNMAVGVNVIKIDPNTGNEILFSDTQIGLMGGLAQDGQPSGEFNEDDLTLAVQRLREQKQAGLTYGMATSSGFIADY